MLAALALPRMLERMPDRTAMLAGAGILALGMLVGPFAGGLASLMPLWFFLGLGYSLTQTPTGGCCGARRMPRIVRRSSPRSSRCRTHAG